MFESQLQKLAQNSLETKRKLEQRRSELDRQIMVLEAELAAYNRTLEAYRRQAGRRSETPEPGAPAELKDLTVADGLELLLRQAGGRDRIAGLAVKLFESGKLKNRSTANSHVRAVINRDKRFRFVTGGWVELALPAQLTFESPH